MSLEIRGKSPRPPKLLSLLARLATTRGRTLLLSAGVTLIVGVVLVVAVWQLLGYPYRRAHPHRSPVAQHEALLALVTAAAAAVAVFRQPA